MDEYWDIRELFFDESTKRIDLKKIITVNDENNKSRDKIRCYLTKLEHFAQSVLINRCNTKIIAKASGKNLITQFYFFSNYIEFANSYDNLITKTYYIEFYILILHILKERKELESHKYYKTLMEISYFDSEIKKRHRSLYKWKIKKQGELKSKIPN